MYELARTVRFNLDLTPGNGSEAVAAKDKPRHNTYAGWPSMRGLGAYYELEVRCVGEADPTTGYVMNIASIDRAVRELAIPHLQAIIHTRQTTDPGRILADLMRQLQPALDTSVVSLRWRLNPYYCLTLRADAMDRIVISQHFDFAAAHRLHTQELSDEANREVFGHCNNANGHGHNYRLRVDASTDLDEMPDRRLSLATLERIVDETVVRRFDHTHLNLDTEEFASLVPSVEHIARTCHELLREPIAAGGGRLEQVTVWETERTSCTYPAGAASS